MILMMMCRVTTDGQADRRQTRLDKTRHEPLSCGGGQGRDQRGKSTVTAWPKQADRGELCEGREVGLGCGGLGDACTVPTEST